ncbi:MAG: hypothetical protein ACKVZJ_02365 [Phycisphaerales bacterium]
MPRMTVDFPSEIYNFLEKLAAEESTTKVNALRRALTLYKVAKEETRAKPKSGKRKLTISDENDKVIKEIVLTS